MGTYSSRTKQDIEILKGRADDINYYQFMENAYGIEKAKNLNEYQYAYVTGNKRRQAKYEKRCNSLLQHYGSLTITKDSQTDSYHID